MGFTCFECLKGGKEVSGEGRAEKSSCILCIGIIDILAAPVYTVLAVNYILGNSFADHEEYIWICLRFLGIFLRLFMGGGLLVGLKCKDGSNLLRYSRFWRCCQVAFLVSSVFEIISALWLFIITPPQYRDIVPPIIVVVIFIYRLVSFVWMCLFIRRLQKSEYHGSETSLSSVLEQLNQNEFVRLS